jgi:hypothetical protein
VAGARDHAIADVAAGEIDVLVRAHAGGHDELAVEVRDQDRPRQPRHAHRPARARRHLVDTAHAQPERH